MNNVPDVQILMATYKGGRFLAEQLDSILKQSYPHWKLLVRDDGSTDNTLDILNAFQEQHPHRITIVQDHIGNLGHMRNFEHLMKLSVSPIVVFADQDDVWMPEKFARCVEAVQKIENRHGSGMPVLVHHDVTVVDADKNIIHASYNDSHGNRTSSPTYKRMPYAAEIHGMAITINRAMVEVALPLPHMTMGHDCLLGCLAQDIGVREFVPEQLALYRRHGSNASQSISLAKRALHKIFRESSSATLVSQLKSIFAEAQNNLDKKCAATLSYLDTYGTRLKPERVAELEKLAHVHDLNPFERKMTIFKYSGTSKTSAMIASLIL